MVTRGRATEQWQSQDTRKTDKVNQPAPSSQQNDCKTTERTQSTAQQNMEQTQNPHNGSKNKQRINNNRITALERTDYEALVQTQ